MIVRTSSATLLGPEGVTVEIEACLQQALPSIVVTGLPGDIVRESRERIRACLNGMGYDVPSSRIVVHLSPATEKKQGSQLDLGIAVAILAVEEMIFPKFPIDCCGFLGELTVDGRLRGVRGALAAAEVLVKNPRVKRIYVPEENAAEVGLLRSEKVRTVSSLAAVLKALTAEVGDLPAPPTEFAPLPLVQGTAVDRIVGQRAAKRALEVALAGWHHLLFVGPPGVGKSLLARSSEELLPPLDESEFVEWVKARGFMRPEETRHARRPFRSPHHSISSAGLLGGGSGGVSCGEVSLAHGGILFLDELPEFRKDALEGLREPLQNGEIRHSRVGSQFCFPAHFLMIGAMNPCPCGFDFDERRKCSCPREKRIAYRRKISGPIYDRIDLCLVLSTPVPGTKPQGPSQSELRESIDRVHALQKKRYGRAMFNSDADLDEHTDVFALDPLCQDWVDVLCAKEYVSFRSLHKTLRVARTIADLAAQEQIGLDHLREAWGLRWRDFSSWR